MYESWFSSLIPSPSNTDPLGRQPTRPAIPERQYFWRVGNGARKSTFLQIRHSKAILTFNNWLSHAGALYILWKSNTFNSIRNSYYSTSLKPHFQFNTLTFLPDTSPNSCRIVFLLTFSSSGFGLPSPAAAFTPLWRSESRSPSENSCIGCVCVCVNVCVCAISLPAIRHRGSGLRSVRLYRDFPSQSSSWNLVDWLLVRSSSAFHSCRKRETEETQRQRESRRFVRFCAVAHYLAVLNCYPASQPQQIPLRLTISVFNK